MTVSRERPPTLRVSAAAQRVAPRGRPPTTPIMLRTDIAERKKHRPHALPEAARVIDHSPKARRPRSRTFANRSALSRTTSHLGVGKRLRRGFCSGPAVSRSGSPPLGPRAATSQQWLRVTTPPPDRSYPAARCIAHAAAALQRKGSATSGARRPNVSAEMVQQASGGA
jgi:hypothetical protein